MEWLTPPVLWFEIALVAGIFWCVYRFMKRRGSRTAAVRDWLVYIVLSIALVVGIAACAIYGPEKTPVNGKWIAFAVNTAFVFGYSLKFVRPLWRRQKLWAVIASMAFAHGIAGFYVISRLERVPLVWYVPIDVAEIWLTLHAVQLFFTDEELLRAASPAEAQRD